MLPHLENDLIEMLKSARKLSVAVALMKDYGLRTIEHNLKRGCERRYVLGIDLPTPPSVLRSLVKLSEANAIEVKARIFSNSQNFHPKVYIVEKSDGELEAIIGSANATLGGFTRNVEMNIRVKDQTECQNLLDWFNNLFESSDDFDEPYIEDYELIYRRNKALSLTQKSNTSVLNRINLIPPGQQLVVNPEQYFRQSDFDAFDPSLHYEVSGRVVDLRGAVRERLIELNNRIQPEFEEYGIDDLHLPEHRNNYTSQHFHSRGNNHIPKHAIWLNYGKSPAELARYPDAYKSFVSHARIQIILGNTEHGAYIGIWLYVAKANWSFHDRAHLQKNLSNENFVQRLYDYFSPLGGAYWIRLDNERLELSNLISSFQLRDFMRRDNYTQEFVIGRNYDPNDSDISEENIEETVLIEFSKLYKIYDLIRDRR